MDKQNNLATDAENYTYHEVIVYSAMIHNVFGGQSFSIALLKEALEEIKDNSISDYYVLCQEFNLPNDKIERIAYSVEDLQKAKNALVTMNQILYFISKTRKEALSKEIETLIRLDENVLNHSLYFENWETSLECILDNFLEKSKGNPKIESFDRFSKLVTQLQNALIRRHIYTINDLSKFSEKYKKLPIEESRKKSILEIRNIGLKCLDILREALKEFDFEIA